MSVLKFFIVILFSYTGQCNICKVLKPGILLEAEKRTVAENNIVIVRCASNAIKEITKTFTQDLNATCATSADPSTTNNSDTVDILKATFELFSNKCKDFTLAMSLKHQLLNWFFNQRAQNLNNSQISQFSLILIHLQTIANILDDAQFREQSNYCIRLSSHGYRTTPT